MKAAFRRVRASCNRAQSAVSELVSNLEAQLGVVLFDRSERYPKLTPAGIQLVADARSVVTNVDLLKARRERNFRGLESELSAVVDVLFPIEAIAESAKEFRDRFPRRRCDCMLKRSAARTNRCSTSLQLRGRGFSANRTGLHDSRTIARAP